MTYNIVCSLILGVFYEIKVPRAGNPGKIGISFNHQIPGNPLNTAAN